MARYDRIAPLPAPAREAVFPGWLVLADLEGRERDAELARRARLRFLALRPLRRILAVGPDGATAASYARQIEGIREELGHLPARDPERIRLSRYLHEIETRSPAELALAAAGLGELAEDADHAAAAEEFYRTALELGERFDLTAARAVARRRLGLLCATLGRTTDAERELTAAVDAAAAAGAHGEWARASSAAALLALARGDGARARATLGDVLKQGRTWSDAETQSVAGAALSQVLLAAGEAESALENAWSALERAGDPSTRAAALHAAGMALRALGLYDAAARSHDLVVREPAVGPSDRWRAEGELATTLAEAGRLDEFLAARRRMLREAREAPPAARAAALLHLRLAQACVLAGAPDFARDHLREGLQAARRGGYGDLVGELEALLPRLERESARALAAPGAPRSQPGARARSIADAIQAHGATAGRS